MLSTLKVCRERDCLVTINIFSITCACRFTERPEQLANRERKMKSPNLQASSECVEGRQRSGTPAFYFVVAALGFLPAQS